MKANHPPPLPLRAVEVCCRRDGVLVVCRWVMLGSKRAEWNSGISSCLGKNDELFSSDLEVCVMGCCAPCVLHGANVERLGSSPASFTTHCLPYACLYFVRNCLFGWNCLAPWFSYPVQPFVEKFNLGGSCESMAGSIGCSDNIRMDEAHREHCESASHTRIVPPLFPLPGSS